MCLRDCLLLKPLLERPDLSIYKEREEVLIVRMEMSEWHCGAARRIDMMMNPRGGRTNQALGISPRIENKSAPIS